VCPVSGPPAGGWSRFLRLVLLRRTQPRSGSGFHRQVAWAPEHRTPNTEHRTLNTDTLFHMNRIGIIDYGMGNLGSVTNACRFSDSARARHHDARRNRACDALILPGVGAFGDCMTHLRDHGFVEPVRSWIAEDRPFLGICVGLQALFEGSEESPGAEGSACCPASSNGSRRRRN
jgi:hypothetical protein